jgi:hypothetical protein
VRSPFEKWSRGPVLAGISSPIGHLAELNLSRRFRAAASSAFHNRSCCGRDDICVHSTYPAKGLQRGAWKAKSGSPVQLQQPVGVGNTEQHSGSSSIANIHQSDLHIFACAKISGNTVLITVLIDTH